MDMNAKIYFDYNIYDGIAKGLFNLPEHFKENKLFVSVAHAEEYYNAKCNNIDVKNHQKLKKIENMMRKSSEIHGVLNPSKKGVFLKMESFKDPSKRIARYDTRNSIENTSVRKYNFRKIEYENLLDNNQELMYISNLDEKEIWEQTVVRDKLKNIKNRIDDHNMDIINNLIIDYGVQAYDLEKIYKLPYFEIVPNMYNDTRMSYVQLEFSLEVLGDILNEVGYCKDNKVEKVKSGVYDTEHSIYATYCDLFITNDKKLTKRLNAIYGYLGVGTRCISYNEFEKVFC